MSPAPASTRGTGIAPAYLVKGEDASLVAQGARALIEQLVGERDPALVVEEHGGSSADDLDTGAVVDACTTPPFLVDRRVVVVRDAGRLAAADAKRLVGYLADPLSSTALVVVAGGGTVPQALVKAIGASGEVIDTSAGRGIRERRGWLADKVRASPVNLDNPAANRLAEHLGEDLGRLAGILETLAAAYGDGATIGLDELTPYLGGAGAVPPWDLTDAIDGGATAKALSLLQRMTGPGGRPAPLVINDLHRHYSQMLRLDGTGITSGEEAAAVLGISAYPAKKALAQCRELGGERIGQAILLIADADLDVKGRTALPTEMVLEVLVARLSRLARPHRR